MFKLEADPVFPIDVDIPIPGKKAERIQIDVRHKTRSEFDALVESISAGEKTVEDVVRELVITWTAPGVDYSPEALETCFQLFPGSPLAIYVAYRSSLVEGRRKN